MKFIKEIFPYVVIIIVVVLIRTFIATPAIVNGDSMNDTLFDGEMVLVNKYDKDKLERFDIVVVKYNGEKLIKRIIGLPNEEISYIDNILYINGKKFSVPIDFEYTSDFDGMTEDNQYFVLGDNRNISKDSRMIGPINKSDIEGKVNIILFPFSKIGTIE